MVGLGSGRLSPEPADFFHGDTEQFQVQSPSLSLSVERILSVATTRRGNDGTAEPSRTFVADTKSGDTRKALEALRDRLAAELDGKSGTGVAALAAQLLLVLRELRKLSPDQPGEPIQR